VIPQLFADIILKDTDKWYVPSIPVRQFYVSESFGWSNPFLDGTGSRRMHQFGAGAELCPAAGGL